MTKKILVAYTNYGTGHQAAAEAIQQHIRARYPQYKVQLIDPLTYSRPLVNKLFTATGRLIATKFRKFRRNIYQRSLYDHYLDDHWFYRFCVKLFWTRKLQTKITAFAPDIIIATQVGPAGLFAAHKDIVPAKLIVVFTDYGIHRMYTCWHELVDSYWVPCPEIQQTLAKIGIDPAKIRITGIPVCQQLRHHSPQVPHLLFVCGGGLGYSHALPYFAELLQSPSEFSYTFVAGRNQKLYRRAQQLAQKSTKPGQVIPYTDKMPELIAQSTLVLGKPGGIIVSEALNAGVPFCAVVPIPGQEVNNAHFLVKHHFGYFPTNLSEFANLINDTNLPTDLAKITKHIHHDFHKFTLPQL